MRRRGYVTGAVVLFSLVVLYTCSQTESAQRSFDLFPSDAWRVSRRPKPCFGALERGRKVLHDVYSESLAGVTHVAVLDWPWHHNSGDSAIWLGEVALLEALGKKISYICGIDDCKKEDMEKAFADLPISETAVLLHGGGNFGDIWTSHQQLRNQIVQEMPDRKIRHFPQTFEFDLEKPSKLLEKTIATYLDHPDIELVARDIESHTAMQRAFPGKPVRLTPDAAFYIGYDPKSALTPPAMRPHGADMSILNLKGSYASSFTPAPSLYDNESSAERSPFGWPDMSFSSPAKLDVLVLARYDKEGGQDRQSPDNWIPPLAPYEVRIADWADQWKGIKQPAKAHYGTIDNGAGEQVSFENYWNQAALLRVQWAMELLSSGKIVISDRLHTEIISTLLGLGHIAVESGHLRKMEKVIDTWLAPCLVPLGDMDAVAAGATRRTDANTVFVHDNAEAVEAAKAWLSAEEKGIRWSRVSE
jgi:exopolysaccharide biosynthesis predicted pyruvyltransferase EpsI